MFEGKQTGPLLLLLLLSSPPPPPLLLLLLLLLLLHAAAAAARLQFKKPTRTICNSFSLQERLSFRLRKLCLHVKVLLHNVTVSHRGKSDVLFCRSFSLSLAPPPSLAHYGVVRSRSSAEHAVWPASMFVRCLRFCLARKLQHVQVVRLGEEKRGHIPYRLRTSGYFLAALFV